MNAEDVTGSPPAADDGSEEEAKEQTQQAKESAENALRASISKLGKHSYYYAHAHKIDDTALWDGSGTPRLLNRKAAAESPVVRHKVPITSYSWADETAQIKLYLPMEDAASIPDDNIKLVSGERTLTLDVLVGTEDRRLHLTDLNGDINGAALRKRADKIIVTLKKKEEVSWYNLRKNDS